MHCAHCQARVVRRRRTRAEALVDLLLYLTTLLASLKLYEALSGWRVALALLLVAFAYTRFEAFFAELEPAREA